MEEGVHGATGVPSTLLDVLDSAPVKGVYVPLRISAA